MSSPLNYSRVSKADSEALRSTGASLVFKTVGRNIKPSWSNRITKDVNDLSYNIDINFFGKNQFKSMTLERRRNINSRQKKVGSARQKRKSFFSEQLSKIIKTARTIDYDLQTKNDNKKNDKSKGKSDGGLINYGLSPFQFKNTIKGKLQTKPNVHLKFENQVGKKDDLRPIWYNSQMQIDIEKMDAKKYRRILQKFHPFQSYTQRKVFETKDKVDKIYQIQTAKRKTSPNRIKRTVPIETVPGRRQEQIKQSSYLSYETQQGQKAVLPASPKYTILKTPKKFSFSRQVIDEKRGCYR